MWWQFKSAFARKLGYLLAALFFALILGHRARAAGTCFEWQLTGLSGNYATGSQACSANLARISSSYHYGISLTSSSPSGPPTASGQTLTCVYTYSTSTGLTATTGGTGASVSLACPADCAGQPNMDLFGAITASTSSTGSGFCVNSCEYLNGNTTMNIGGGTNRVSGLAFPSGLSCGASTVDIPASAGSCVSKGGSTACVTDSPSGANVNGDPITPTNVAASGTCVSFSSGGAMCTVPLPGGGTGSVQAPQTMPTPPGPDSGTAGTPATPDAVIVTGGNQVNYYKAATVAASTVGVGTTGVTPTGAPGTGAVTGTGSGVVATCPQGQTCTNTDSTSGGDDCSAPPACTDADPVSCGIQRQLWLNRCQQLVPIAEADIANAVTTMGGAVGTVPASTVDVSTVISTAGSTQFGSVTAAGSASCPPPITINIGGQTISLDLFAHVCEFASQISWIILIIAYMVAARVMFTGATANTF